MYIPKLFDNIYHKASVVIKILCILLDKCLTKLYMT